MFDPLAEQHVSLTLYTDSYVIQGSIRTRQRRVTDILNETDEAFVILEDVSMDEFGSHDLVRAPYAHINLDSVLFAVALTPVAASPELRTAKARQRAIISVPPFRVTGVIHVPANEELRNALTFLRSRFIPVTEAMYWSDRLAEARTQAVMVAVNQARAQILAPFEEIDPWSGLRSTEGGASA